MVKALHLWIAGIHVNNYHDLRVVLLLEKQYLLQLIIIIIKD